jgi:hypothetical protein
VNKKFTPLDLEGVKTHPLKLRKSKVKKEAFAHLIKDKDSFSNFFSSLPNILAGAEIREIISRWVEAKLKQKIISFGMGAHVIKVGLTPLIVDLMKRGGLSHVALNGAGIIHDVEIAIQGETSEGVEEEISSGKFGMAEETAKFINGAIVEGTKYGWGLGEAVGRKIKKENLPFKDLSILYSGTHFNIPVTVHVALGTDIIHMHPSCNPESVGRSTHQDFRLFASVIGRLEGGVYFNIGSSVVLPEVFLKALTLARNLGYQVKNFTTVNLDFIAHYRPLVNVVKRPTKKGGKGFNLIGHHEIMLPLMIAAFKDALQKK